MIATIVGVLLGFFLSVFMDIYKNRLETRKLNTYADYLLTDTFKIIEKTLINIEENNKNSTFEEFAKESHTNKRLLEYNIACLNDIEIAKLRNNELIVFSMSKRIIVSMVSEIKEDIDKVKDDKSLETFMSNLSIKIKGANDLVNEHNIIVKNTIDEMYS